MMCAVLMASACARTIGDDCTTNVQCSALGDRFCDLSSPGGYCTVEGCDSTSCPAAWMSPSVRRRTSFPVASATSRTMRAAHAERYGPPSVLAVRDVSVPTVGKGEVLVQVAAAGLSRAALHLLTGTPYLLRLAGFGLRAPKRAAGIEVAGTVVAVGAEVTIVEALDRLVPNEDIALSKGLERAFRKPLGELVFGERWGQPSALLSPPAPEPPARLEAAGASFCVHDPAALPVDMEVG